MNDSIKAVCFPPACLAACSFDRDLMHEMGSAIEMCIRDSFFEALQFFERPVCTSGQIPDVKLNDFFSGSTSCVGDVE